MLLKSIQKCALIPGAVALALVSTSLSSSAEESAPRLEPTQDAPSVAPQMPGMVITAPDGRTFRAIITPQGQIVLVPLENPAVTKFRENIQLLASVTQRVSAFAYVNISVEETFRRMLAGFPQDTLDKAGIDLNDGTVYTTSNNTIVDTLANLYEHIDVADFDRVTEAAVSSLMSSLDAHSSYTPPIRAEDYRNRTNGGFGGVGLTVGIGENGEIKIISNIAGSPAANAGLQADDLIVEINGQSTTGMEVNDAVELMRGRVGESVTVTIQRGDTVLQPITLVRAVIEQSPVTYSNVDGVGVIRLRQFSANATARVEEAIRDLESQGVTSYALDLRYNPGGLLTQAASIADLFLDKEEIIVSQRDRNGNGNGFVADTHDMIGGKPLVVLTNGASASASEIVAGALQYHGRAQVIGETTFGKGSVQTVFPVSRGLAATTTALYFIADDVSIQNTGVVPNIRVTFGEAAEVEGVITREATRALTIPNPNPINHTSATRECRPANDNVSLFNNLASPFQLSRGDERTVDATLLCAIEHLRGSYQYTVQPNVSTHVNVPVLVPGRQG